MAHYAFIDQNNIVVNVITGCDEGNMDWEQFYSMQHGMACKRTSYNTYAGVHYNWETGQPSEDQSKAFRKNYAGIGYSYDPERDAFIPPQPYPSWALNEQTCQYEPPTPRPDDGFVYFWDEENLTWVKQEDMA